jgi:hypothetical protein
MTDWDLGPAEEDADSLSGVRLGLLQKNPIPRRPPISDNHKKKKTKKKDRSDMVSVDSPVTTS